MQAINNRGHVVGTYTEAGNTLQRVFVFTGTAVNIFGHFPAADTVQTAENDEGEILIADISTTTTASYRAICGGSGC